MLHATSCDTTITELGIGALSLGSTKYPVLAFLDVREHLKDADIFVGHIADRVRAGNDPVFNPSREVLLGAAIEMVAELQSIDAERNLLLMELMGHCRNTEDSADAEAIVEAVHQLAMKISSELQAVGLYQNGKLYYGLGRFVNGQVELVRKTFDDPNYNFATGGFVIPSWVANNS